ncbi:hypothetical protein Hanom_Chr03g00274921 [Helianthus anomalus]
MFSNQLMKTPEKNQLKLFIDEELKGKSEICGKQMGNLRRRRRNKRGLRIH